MSDTVLVRVWVATRKVGSECDTVIDFEKEDWEGMSDNEKDEACKETMWEMCDWGYDEK
jgi:hypothetical protein